MKDLRVLELNADLIPLNLVPLSTIIWRDAFKKIVEGTAVALKYYDDEWVGTPSGKLRVPSVIVLKEYKYLKKFAKWSKPNVKLRDEYRCQYCGKRFHEKSLTIDHVIPKKDGGKHGWLNDVTACKPCNAKKGSNYWKPLRTPYRPSYFELAKKMAKHKDIHITDWKDYIHE